MQTRLTKGELKRQRDSLRQYQRYLPTLQLKKQQLQMEILRQGLVLEGKRRALAVKKQAALEWAGLLCENTAINSLVRAQRLLSRSGNTAGVDVVVFQGLEFAPPDYDLFITPLWVDGAVEQLRQMLSLREEIRILKQAIAVLRQELRITTQRVNLFEKVRIPEAREAIRRIKIYIGDQTANAVGRSKIAKRKIEALYILG